MPALCTRAAREKPLLDPGAKPWAASQTSFPSKGVQGLSAQSQLSAWTRVPVSILVWPHLSLLASTLGFFLQELQGAELQSLKPCQYVGPKTFLKALATVQERD